MRKKFLKFRLQGGQFRLLHNLLRNLRMFLDISELIVLNKNESLGKNDLIILSQMCGYVSYLPQKLLSKKVRKKRKKIDKKMKASTDFGGCWGQI